MIDQTELFEIGKFIKTHGLKGELVLVFGDNPLDSLKSPYLVCPIDDIFVPFFIKSCRNRGTSSLLITLEDITTIEKAEFLVGSMVYYPRKYYKKVESEDITIHFFVGFELVDKKSGKLGIIREVDAQTINKLFLVDGQDKEYIIPFVDDFIECVDADKKIIYLNLPEGLVDGS